MGRSSQETKLSKEIRDAFKVIGLMHERVQCGIIPLRHGGYLHLASNGCPDIWTKLGFVEVKDQTDLSPEQVAWHEKARNNGVRVAVARSKDEALQIIDKWKKEDKEKMSIEQDDSKEIQIAAKRYKEARARLIDSDVWREFLDAADEFNDTLGIDAVNVSCARVEDTPIGLTVTEPDATVIAPTEPEQKYDNATVDALVRSALSGIDTVESALTIIKLATDCGLDSKTVSKSLKRIGARTNGGVKRGVRYYLPVAAQTEEV